MRNGALRPYNGAMPKKRSGKASDVKDTRVEFRTSRRQRARIIQRAKLYAGGNVSLWLEYAAEAAPPRFLIHQK